jgi:hypothetical protein
MWLQIRGDWYLKKTRNQTSSSLYDGILSLCIYSSLRMYSKPLYD